MAGKGGDDDGSAETATAAAAEGPLVGCSPASLSSPMSSYGSRAGSLEQSCSLDKFMEVLETLSPDGQQLQLEKRQVSHSNGPSIVLV